MYRIEVVLEDGRALTADVDGRDIRAWEAEARDSFLASTFSYSQLTDLARLALRRSGQLELDKAAFDAACVEVKELERPQTDPT